MGKRDAGTYGRRARSKIVRRGEAEEGEERREGGTEKGKDRLEHPEQPSPVLLTGALTRVLLLDLVTLKLDEGVEFFGNLRREGGERESESASTSSIFCGSDLFSTSFRGVERGVMTVEAEKKARRTNSNFCFLSCNAKCFATLGFSLAKRTISERSRS